MIGIPEASEGFNNPSAIEEVAELLHWHPFARCLHGHLGRRRQHHAAYTSSLPIRQPIRCRSGRQSTLAVVRRRIERQHRRRELQRARRRQSLARRTLPRTVREIRPLLTSEDYHEHSRLPDPHRTNQLSRSRRGTRSRHHRQERTRDRAHLRTDMGNGHGT